MLSLPPPPQACDSPPRVAPEGEGQATGEPSGDLSPGEVPAVTSAPPAKARPYFVASESLSEGEVRMSEGEIDLEAVWGMARLPGGGSDGEV